jgi:signal transduction histidine kinase
VIVLRRSSTPESRVDDCPSAVRVLTLGWSIAGTLGDALLGLGVALVLAAVISAGQAGRPDPLAYAWAVGLGAIMLVRRRYPRIVLVVTALGLFAYYAAGYPAIGIAVPVAAALFSAAEAGRLAAATTTAALVLAVATGYRLLAGQDPSFVIGYELITHITVMAAAIALGDGVRSRRALIARQREVAALSARRQAEGAERRRRDERLAVARDLHDTLGHALAVVSLHADVAREALEPDGDHRLDEQAARAALVEVKRASSAAMADLRETVAVLRNDDPADHRAGTEPSVSLVELDRLLEPARRAGLTVSTVISVDPDVLAGPVQAAAYRIVQEAVTNTVRHSLADSLSVEVSADDDQLLVTVIDDGDPTPSTIASGSSTDGSSTAGGHGLAGMAERATALGGWLRAGPQPGQFVVRAGIPLQGRS